MYKKVETEEEMNIFDSIWIPAWQEKGFELECLLGDVERYLIHNEQNEYIGSVSFRPYHLDSTIDEVFPFHQNEVINKNIGSVMEIENLAILEQYRGKDSLERVLCAIANYGRNNNVKKYIAVLDFILYRALKFLYPVSIVSLQKKITYKNTNLVPVIINMDDTILHIEKYKWLHHFFLSKESSVKG